jgi:uncharacterized membrane protein SpoIIM required for sporulation
MFWGDYDTLWLAVFGLLILTALLARVGVAHFQREELLGRDIDVLNVRWGLKLFIKAFLGGARNIKDWYYLIFRGDLRKIGWPILLMFVVALVGMILGAAQVAAFHIPVDKTSFLGLSGRLETMTVNWQIGDFSPVLSIFWQNTRAMLIAVVLGFISLGILGSIPLIITMGIAGFLYQLLTVNGLAPWAYLLFVLPHGLIEIPAMVIASAGILHAGALMATPDRQKTVGEIWIESMAVWCRLMLGLVIPMLFVAAMVEAWITPRFALLFVR